MNQIVNVPLLRKAVEWAEAEAAKPEPLCEWYQEQYMLNGEEIQRTCGTCYCVAGWIVHTVDGDVPGWWLGDETAKRAGELLGIDGYEHVFYEDGLFFSSNTIEDVRRIAENIAAEAGERL